MVIFILLVSLFTTGLYVAGHQPYLLFDVRYWFGERVFKGTYRLYNDGERDIEEFVFKSKPRKTSINENLWKPFWGCLPCMASFWGVVIYSLVATYDIHSIYELPIIIIGASGLNYIIKSHLLKDL